MKGGVEAGCLGDAGEIFLGEADRGQGRGRVQGRKGDRTFKFGEHRWVDEAMLAQRGPAMDDPVPDGGRLRHS